MLVQSLRDGLKDMKNMLNETTRQVREAEEKNKMAAAEIASVHSQTETNRTETMELKKQIELMQQQNEQDKKQFRLQLKMEEERRKEAERDRAAMESRLQAALSALNNKMV